MEDVIKQWQDSQKKQGLEVKEAYYAPPKIKIRHNYNLLKTKVTDINQTYNSSSKPPFEEDFMTQTSILYQIEYCLGNCYTIACSVIKYKKLASEDNYPFRNPYKTLAKNGLYDTKKAEFLYNVGLFLDYGAPRMNLRDHPNLVRSMIKVELLEFLKFAEAMVKLVDAA